jgi:lactoylglutathione lyase
MPSDEVDDASFHRGDADVGPLALAQTSFRWKHLNDVDLRLIQYLAHTLTAKPVPTLAASALDKQARSRLTEDTKPMRSPDYLTAVGIGVGDLARSADFYSRVLGMKQTQTFRLDHMDEIVLAHEGRSAVVLMHWTDGSARNYRDNPIKLVFYVTDTPGLIERIRAEGLEITTEPRTFPGMGDAVIGLAKDPDGYVIELIQLPAAATASA